VNRKPPPSEGQHGGGMTVAGTEPSAGAYQVLTGGFGACPSLATAPLTYRRRKTELGQVGDLRRWWLRGEISQIPRRAFSRKPCTFESNLVSVSENGPI
jgi:hypothetical protein